MKTLYIPHTAKGYYAVGYSENDLIDEDNDLVDPNDLPDEGNDLIDDPEAKDENNR